MKNLICSILTIFIFSNTQAAVVNWIVGTTGDWNVAANWDSNIVPTAADEVFIVAGQVTIPDGYDAFATRVEVSLTSSLTINPDASLTLDGVIDANAILNSGTLNCRGDIIIDNVTYSGTDTDFGNGIFNSGDVLVTKNGRVLLNDISKSGIRCNGISQSFEHRGLIKVKTTFNGDHGISCNNTNFLNTGVIEILASEVSGLSTTAGLFINKGSIDIQNNNSSGLIISGAFINKGAGNISLKNVNEGISTSNGGDFKNNANLLIQDIGTIGINNDGIFTNAVDGALIIDECFSGGIDNDGTFTNRGFLEVKRITDGNGIVNSVDFVNKFLGTIEFRDIDNIGINNLADATFTNEGTISMVENVINTGILNSGSFRNKLNGSLIIDDTLNIGISNLSANALFINDGTVSINLFSHTTTGIKVEGQFKNRDDGSLLIHDSEQYGLHISSPDAEFVNDGLVHLQKCVEGMNISGTFINKNDLNAIANTEIGITINATGELRNTSGDINFSFNMGPGLINDGLFINKLDGYMFSQNEIQNNGNFKNKGFWQANLTGPSFNTGNMKNIGAIEDRYERILPLINNNSIMALPLSGTVQVGVPYPNALELGTLNNFTVDGWYTDETNTSAFAGSYDQATNTFTADAAAVGDTELWVEVTLTNGPVTSLLRVEVLPFGVIDVGGSAPSYGNNKDQIEAIRRNDEYNEGFSKITLSPNPANDYIHLNLDAALEDATRVMLYNSLGQLAKTISLSGLDAGVTRIDLDQQLMKGMYIIEIQSKTAVLFKERVLLLNH